MSLTLFWPEWLRTGAALCLPLIVLLVGILHLRARRRFRQLSLLEPFLSQYEKSRIVTYAALGVLIGLMVWMLYLRPL